MTSPDHSLSPFTEEQARSLLQEAGFRLDSNPKLHVSAEQVLLARRQFIGQAIFDVLIKKFIQDPNNSTPFTAQEWLEILETNTIYLSELGADARLPGTNYAIRQPRARASLDDTLHWTGCILYRSLHTNTNPKDLTKMLSPIVTGRETRFEFLDYHTGQLISSAVNLSALLAFLNVLGLCIPTHIKTSEGTIKEEPPLYPELLDEFKKHDVYNPSKQLYPIPTPSMFVRPANPRERPPMNPSEVYDKYFLVQNYWIDPHKLHKKPFLGLLGNLFLHIANGVARTSIDDKLSSQASSIAEELWLRQIKGQKDSTALIPLYNILKTYFKEISQKGNAYDEQTTRNLLQDIVERRDTFGLFELQDIIQTPAEVARQKLQQLAGRPTAVRRLNRATTAPPTQILAQYETLLDEPPRDRPNQARIASEILTLIQSNLPTNDPQHPQLDLWIKQLDLLSNYTERNLKNPLNWPQSLIEFIQRCTLGVDKIRPYAVLFELRKFLRNEVNDKDDITPTEIKKLIESLLTSEKVTNLERYIPAHQRLTTPFTDAMYNRSKTARFLLTAGKWGVAKPLHFPIWLIGKIPDQLAGLRKTLYGPVIGAEAAAIFELPRHFLNHFNIKVPTFWLLQKNQELYLKISETWNSQTDLGHPILNFIREYLTKPVPPIRWLIYEFFPELGIKLELTSPEDVEDYQRFLETFDPSSITQFISSNPTLSAVISGLIGIAAFRSYNGIVTLMYPQYKYADPDMARLLSSPKNTNRIIRYYLNYLTLFCAEALVRIAPRIGLSLIKLYENSNQTPTNEQSGNNQRRLK